MRVVIWLAAILIISILLGTCSVLAPGFITIDEHAEGLLIVPMLIAMIAFLSSGVLLVFIIGPAVLEEYLRRIGTRR